MNKLQGAKSSRFRNVFSGILLILLLGLFLAPDAMACHRGDPPKPHGKNGSCGDDPNPNPDPDPTFVPIMFAFDGEVIVDVPANGEGRLCGLGSPWTADAGEYGCATALSPAVRIRTGKYMQGIFSKKYKNICDDLHAGATFTPSDSGFNVGWTDSCFDGRCALEIKLIIEGEQVLAKTGDKADLLDVVMHASVDDTSQDPVADTNPFYNSRNLAITEIDLDYRLSGSNRSVGICKFYVTPYQVPKASMISEPAN